jgi:hypothetical protein
MPKFQPGQSGNPSGRPRQRVDFDRAARRQAKASLRTMVELRDDEKASKAVRLDAAQAILDRAWGKPIAPSTNSVDVGGTVVLQVMTGIARALQEAMLGEAIAKAQPKPLPADSATAQEALAATDDEMPHSPRDQYR